MIPFTAPAHLRAVIANQFIPDLSRIIKRGEPLQLISADQARTVAKRVRAAAALVQPGQMHDELISVAKDLESKRF